MNKLGERIKQLRRTRHLTQQDLAERLGIDQGAISRWERGHIIPSARYRQELEKVLEAPLTEVDQPLLDSVNRDLHFSLVLNCELQILAASETTLAVNGCRSRNELLGASYMPLLNETARSLYNWLNESGAFEEGINWARFILPMPTLHSGYRWMESLWVPFRLDHGELVYRVSNRLLDMPPAEGLGRAILEVDGKQRELLVPAHGLTEDQPKPQATAKEWYRAI